jgi:hypothetical protein
MMCDYTDPFPILIVCSFDNSSQITGVENPNAMYDRDASLLLQDKTVPEDLNESATLIIASSVLLVTLVNTMLGWASGNVKPK